VFTSARITIASEVGQKTVSAGTRAYFQGRLRTRLYNLVLSRFRAAAENDGLTRAELARRIGRQPAVLTRLLNGPGNWTIDTISDLLLGISGEELDATATKPFATPPKNSNYADYQKIQEIFGATSNSNLANGIGYPTASLQTHLPNKPDQPKYKDGVTKCR